jgi:hypothetical protein
MRFRYDETWSVSEEVARAMNDLKR